MTWIIRVGDEEITSDDFLIEDLEQIEKATDTAWSIANPLRHIAVAKAFLAVAMLRLGKTDREVATALKAVTLKQLKSTFDYKPDDEAVVESEEDADPLDRPAKIGRGSRRGRPISGGSHPISESKESETSSAS
jgi:hypothetical protein